MPTTSTTIVWFRHDLRIEDNPALAAAAGRGAVVPVFVWAPEEEAPWAPGAASRWWLHRSLEKLAAALAKAGAPLVIRRGGSLATLQKLAAEVGATHVTWNRRYEPAIVKRDTAIKQALAADGLTVESFNGGLLYEPAHVATKEGRPYQVFTPFWRALLARDEPATPVAAPKKLVPAPKTAAGLAIEALGLLPSIPWAGTMERTWSPGEAGAHKRLDAFLDRALTVYGTERDRPDHVGTSCLSPHLHFGEISPRRIVAALQAARVPAKSQPDLDHYFSELGWREFSHHLLFHFPHTSDENMNPRFAEFRWAEVDEGRLAAWQRGRTGVPIVDAGMRELYATGWMHNRVRMVVASFLTKNLRYHWIHGARWFWDTLVDASLPNNTQGWQWTAGTGADAAPYFRIFSPASQAEKFDPKGAYIQRWVPELARLPAAALAEPWTHGDLLARLAPGYPRKPIVDPKASRAEALAAYSGPKSLPEE